MVARCFWRESEYGEVFPGSINIFTQVGFGIWCWIRCDDIEPTRKVQGGPTRADGSCADDCDTTYWLV